MYRATLPEFCCAGDCCKASYCFCRSSRCFVAIFKLYKAASFSDRIGAIAFAISSSGAGAEKCFSFALKSSASCVFSSSRVWTGATASFTAFAVASIDGKRGGNSERATPKPALSPKMSHSHQSWRRGFHPESNLRPHSGVEFHTLRNKESPTFFACQSTHICAEEPRTNAEKYEAGYSNSSSSNCQKCRCHSLMLAGIGGKADSISRSDC